MGDVTGVTDREWDAVIVGTGIGGATLGFALARSGWRVLFCEKGKSPLDRQSLRGNYAESFFAGPAAPTDEHRAILSRAGRCTDIIEDRSSARIRTFVPFVGSGSGGSSALYGMAMERFFPSDFRPRGNHPGAEETSLPEAWPISYAELEPYYRAAEHLYRVCGTQDPLREVATADQLRPPPALTPQGLTLFGCLENNGLHPYRVPMACEFVPECQCCQGYLCARECKNDSSRVCLQPAIADHGARLLDECEVVRLEATRSAVTEVLCHWQGKQISLRGKVIVLAAGALASPGILLNSASSSWPDGLANESGLVGRNLMRHFTDLYAVFLPVLVAPGDNRRKEIGFSDFYHVPGMKLGSVQSFGRLPPASVLAESLQHDLSQGSAGWLSPMFRLVKPVVGRILRRLVDRSSVLASVVEDLPHPENRVSLVTGPDPQGEARLAVSYRIRPYDASRIRALRRLMKNALAPYRYMLIRQAENNQRIAHACGTCRFGIDSRDSVLNRDNRAHALRNLFVVDSSFFPSSAGTNPALTIAANALRVAASIRPNRG